MSEHTPGPWEHGGKAVRIEESGGGENFSGGDWWIFPPLGDAGPVAIASSEENSRLIAAAPELLQIVIDLQESASYWSEYGVPLGIVDRINAAIQKATT